MGYLMILIAVLSMILAIVCFVLALCDERTSDKKRGLLLGSAVICVVTAACIGWTGVAKITKNVLSSNAVNTASPERPK